MKHNAINNYIIRKHMKCIISKKKEIAYIYSNIFSIFDNKIDIILNIK